MNWMPDPNELHVVLTGEKLQAWLDFVESALPGNLERYDRSTIRAAHGILNGQTRNWYIEPPYEPSVDLHPIQPVAHSGQDNA